MIIPYTYRYENTFLHQAVKEEDKEKVEFLIHEGASPYITDDDGYDAIDYARKLKENNIKELLERSW